MEYQSSAKQILTNGYVETKPTESNTTIRPIQERQVVVANTSQLTNDDRQRISELEQQLERKRLEVSALEDGVRLFGNDYESYLNSAKLSERDIIRQLEELNEKSLPFTINGLDISLTDTDNSVEDNVLNQYMNVQYHIGLTMISEQDAKRFQQGLFDNTNLNIDTTFLRTTNREERTIASTGDSYTNSNKGYFNITDCSITNVVEPTVSNPLISTMLSMKLKIQEPHGMDLYQDMRDLAIELGYKNINMGRVLYRVDISFSGFDQDTGEWTEQIDISAGKGITTISSIMNITQMDADVNASGTSYSLGLMPSGHQAYRPEDFIIDASTFGTGNTLRDFLSKFSQSLSLSKDEQTQHRIKRNYEFLGPNILLDSPFDVELFLQQNQLIQDSPSKESTISHGHGVDIINIIQSALRNTFVAKELFNADINNDTFIKPKIHFGIRFNTVYGDRDERLNDYYEITHQYIIEPYITFKHASVNENNIDLVTQPDNQLRRVKEIINYGMLRRVYNYINTGENTEVLGFDIKLKAFYYNSLIQKRRAESTSSIGYGGAASDVISDTIEPYAKSDLIRIVTDNNPRNTEETVKRLFGRFESNTITSSNGADRLGGGFNINPTNYNRFGSTSSTDKQTAYDTYLDDYLKLDMLKLNGMEIRGDPVWLLSPYSNLDISKLEKIGASSTVGKASLSGKLSVQARNGQIIFIKIYPPKQEDLMNPDRKAASSSPSIIGGFYQVTKITSNFSNGKFTQSLDGVKLNHLNYVEEVN